VAENPWRCSQCGTINEPVANSCRTCGKWPSLFDLEDNAIDEDADFEEVSPEPEPVQTYEAPEPVTIEVETFEEPATEPSPAAPRRGRFGPPTTEPVLDEGESSRPRWVTWIVPVAVVGYFVLSYFFSGR
jgi:hypothetical protein